MAKVEVCAGEGQLSSAIRDAGFRVKPFDVSWIVICLWIPTSPEIHQPNKNLTVVMGWWLQVRYSGNHNILRTTGLLTLLAAVIFSAIFAIFEIFLQCSSEFIHSNVHNLTRWEIYARVDSCSWHHHAQHGYSCNLAFSMFWRWYFVISH